MDWPSSKQGQAHSLRNWEIPPVRRGGLNFSQAFNPIGSIAGVLVGTTFIFSGIELTQRQTRGHEGGWRHSMLIFIKKRCE